MFVCINGKSKEVTEIFAGGKDGLAHRIKEIFGSVNGVAKLVYSEKRDNNAFDEFTWAEIKQLATDGLLLEHFNIGDTVTIKLKTSLTKTISYSNDADIILAQKELPLKIVELTETKMRLMSPIATILNGQFNLWKETITTYGGDPNKWTSFNKYVNNSEQTLIKNAWGMNSGYNCLKMIDNALPDDFREALSICARPIISFTGYSTGQRVIEYDEDLRVRQISDDLWKAKVNTEDVPYTVDLLETYYPRNFSAHLKYYNVPEERKSQIESWIKQYGIGFVVPFSQYVYTSSNWYMYYTTSPSKAYSWDRTDYNTNKSYLNSVMTKDILTSYRCNLPGGIVPEMIIGE